MTDTETKAVLTDNTVPAVVIQPPKDVEPERISPEDKDLLNAMKYQRDLAVAAAETAVANGKLAEANHRNVVLQFAHKYRLVDGDRINEDGTIVRKTK
jgi:hypothetical protein